MNKSGFDISWMFRIDFIKWVAGGSAGTFILMLLLTSSHIITPLYESETIIYVPLTLISQQHEQLGIGFGNYEEIDAHIQILRSTRLLDSLDTAFSFSESLGIDLDDPGGHSRYYRVAGNLITASRTRYGSVSVRVRNRDRLIAADMANRIVTLGDQIKDDILLENRLAAHDFARELYLEKLEETLEIERQFTEQDSILPLLPARAMTDETSLDDIFRYAEGTHATNPDVIRQFTIYEAELWALTSLKNNYERIRKSLDTPIPRSYVVSTAVIAERPVWPPRLPIAVAGVIVYVITLVFFRIIRMD